MTATAYSVDVRRMEAFSALELYALLKLRVDVFVVEQACAYPELDGKDADALHLRLLIDGETAAYARLVKPEDDFPRIGRVIVAPDHRGSGLGSVLMRAAIDACGTHFPGQPIALSAQSHLEPFYRSLGFVPTSAEYVEDSIPHVDMVRPAEGHERAS
ncbi:GNAT family N-acetyltransferase [Shinella oryzae]|uniref:GNAT family N-acetyltransferase n=1 Tax=Shinella oryzae TaxID=2871820 RepID=UPI001FF28013|nr:GNAT family N-acetyltransferase [Shinella oryzae]UPA25777.1 GNAT family N-acetyltransferase [Shinella oryzae]